MSTKTDKPTWEFAARFRRHTFGWKSQPAITRIREAVSEIKAVARKDPVRGAEGAVMFLVRLSPAIEHVDSSSGSIGNAVNRAIDALAPVIADAPADLAIRRRWLEALFEAHGAESIPYIEPLGDHWGTLCASPTLAAEWADALAPTIETAWRRYPQEHVYFHGTNMGLSAMLAARQYDRLLDLLDKCPYRLWHDHQWGVKALAALGRTEEALQYAEALQEQSARRAVRSPGPAKPSACPAGASKRPTHATPSRPTTGALTSPPSVPSAGNIRTKHLSWSYRI